jgi:Outer membrane protein beta-barrel domain
MTKTSYLALLLLLSGPAAMAADEEFQISPRLGKGNLQIHSDLPVDHTAVDVDTFGAGITFGYVTPIGVLAEGGYTSQGNWNFFGARDDYRLREYTIAIGYQFETPRGFRLIPKAGREHWDLYTDDGAFHSGATIDQTLRGNDYFWEVSLEKKLRRAVALGVTYRDNHLDFGNVRLLAFTMNFAM